LEEVKAMAGQVVLVVAVDETEELAEAELLGKATTEEIAQAVAKPVVAVEREQQVAELMEEMAATHILLGLVQPALALEATTLAVALGKQQEMVLQEALEREVAETEAVMGQQILEEAQVATMVLIFLVEDLVS
jgi:hypothetical protein